MARATPGNSAGPGLERRHAVRRRRLRADDLILIVAVVAFGAGLLYFGRQKLLEVLYSPAAGIILVVMVVEYLVLKSSDRTRVYRIENLKLRERRRRDEELLRRARQVLQDGVRAPDTEEQGRPGDWKRRADDICDEISDRL